MTYFLYILLCDQKTFYIGITENLEKRLDEHKNKQSFFTKKFSDIQLVYQETYTNRKQAQDRESQLKGWSIAKKKALIKGDTIQLKNLSKAVNWSKYPSG